MKRIILLANFLFSVLVFAQPGTIDLTFNPTYVGSGLDKTTSIQNDGKIIITGSFTSYNGVGRNRIARLNTDGTLDTNFNPGAGPNHVVYTTSTQSDGKIIIGGYFTSYNGVGRNRIARLNTDGTLDTNFNPGAGANGGVVYTTSIQSDGKIIIGGSFTSYNGIARNGIARLNTDGTLETDFNQGTGITFSEPNDIYYVRTSSIQSDGKIIFAGNFTSYNGIATNGIARLNTNGTLDNTFAGQFVRGEVYKTSVQSDGKITIAFSYRGINDLPYYKLTRLNTNGTLDTTFKSATGLEDKLNTFSIQNNGKIIIGGFFHFTYPIPTKTFVRLNNDGSLDTNFNPGTGANGNINSISIQSDGKFIIVGDFTSYNGIGRNFIARINGDTTLNTNGFEQNILNIFPNPSSGCFTIQLDDLITTKTIEVYTILGQKIYNQSLTENETSLDLTAQPKGVYLYKVFGEKGEVKSGKLVID